MKYGTSIAKVYCAWYKKEYIIQVQKCYTRMKQEKKQDKAI